jgi:LemA protein
MAKFGAIGCVVILVLAVILGLVVAGTYNSLNTLDQGVRAQWGQVENVYQRRADLVPNLVETVKGYAAHERETLEAVVSARAQATQVKLSVDQLTPENLQRFEAAQGQLRSALGRLLAVAENYPQLKANENFRDLQAQLEGTENRIAIARRRYIERIREFNDLVTVPPTSWTNSLFYKKQPKAQFAATAEGAERAPAVKFGK